MSRVGRSNFYDNIQNVVMTSIDFVKEKSFSICKFPCPSLARSTTLYDMILQKYNRFRDFNIIYINKNKLIPQFLIECGSKHVILFRTTYRLLFLFESAEKYI